MTNKTLADEIALAASVRRHVDGLVAEVVKQAVQAERFRCWALAKDEAEERASSGDPEGAGVLRDLMQTIKDGPR